MAHHPGRVIEARRVRKSTEDAKRDRPISVALLEGLWHRRDLRGRGLRGRGLVGHQQVAGFGDRHIQVDRDQCGSPPVVGVGLISEAAPDPELGAPGGRHFDSEAGAGAFLRASTRTPGHQIAIPIAAPCIHTGPVVTIRVGLACAFIMIFQSIAETVD